MITAPELKHKKNIDSEWINYFFFANFVALLFRGGGGFSTINLSIQNQKFKEVCTSGQYYTILIGNCTSIGYKSTKVTIFDNKACQQK